IKADDQAIQTILLGLPEDIYDAVDSCETAQEIWLRVQQMMKGSDIGIQEKKAKLFNEWERFTSNEGESIESYYHRFLKLMNDLKRNKHFLEKMASNLKFLNNLQLEWSRHVAIVHQTKDLHTADYTQLYDFLKYNQKEVDDLKAERLAKTQDPLALMANSNNPYAFPSPHQDQSSFNQNYLQQPMPNPKDIIDPTTAMNMALALISKAFKLNYSSPTNNNQRISSNPCNRQIAQQCMNMGQDRQMQMVGGNGRNQLRQYAGQNAGNMTVYNDVIGNQNHTRNGNLVAARAEGNTSGQNGNHIRCYNCRGVGHYARNCTVRPRRRDAAYLQTQLLIAQKEEAGIQLQAEEYVLMADAAYIDEIKEVNANCILIANLQQASTSGTQTDNALVYDSDGSAEVHENCDDNEIFNMFTKEEQYTELLEPIPELHQVPQNDNNVISEATSMEQGRETVEQHHANFEKTRALYESLYNNLAIEVKKVNSVNQETLQLAQESREKMKQLNKEIKPANYTKINYFSGVFVPQTAMLREELYFSNISKTANVSKSISIPNEDFSDDTTPSVARKFLNEEAAKFVGDFKSLANEIDASLAKHKALELEIERLLKAVVSQDIMNIVQKESDVDISDLQTELECTKERFKNCIIKKENKYVKLWNDWYKKCDECKYDKISYDKAYKDMQQKIERLQAQLGDLKGKSKDTSCVSDTRNPLSHKLENKNVELEFQVLNYARENAHLKGTYKNLFASISVSRTQTKTIIASFQNELQSTIYKNDMLRTQLFKKVSDQKDNTCVTSKNTKFAKQPIVENLPKVGESHALSKPVTSNSVSTPQESKVMNNDKVIPPGMFRINPFKTSRDEKHVPNIVRASDKKKPITVSQPPVITKKDVNSDVNGLCFIGVDNTAKTRRTQPRSSSKNNNVPYVVKSSYKKNKEADGEENHMNLLSSSNKKHVPSKCNNVKLATQNVYSKVVCAMCKQCLISVNHDVCSRNYVNGINSRGKKQNANVFNVANQKKHKAQLWKPKNVGSKERLVSPKPRSCLRWSPTGRFFDLKGNIIASRKSESQSECSSGDNVCSSNPLEPISKRFPNSTFSMTGQNWFNSLLIPLLFEYKPLDKGDHGNNECVIC
nr:hypothetical protein [Tanacetum cinerariifolium]